MNAFEQGLARYLSAEQLKKIQNTKIGIAGCGGLGSNLAHALVRTGFKNFEIVDADTIDATNLNRQNYYLDEISQSKVIATAKRLKQINPDTQIKTEQIYLTKENIINYFSQSDILFEAFDNIQSKQLLLETFGNSNKLIIMGNGLAGVNNDPGIKIRKFRKNVFIVGDGLTQADPSHPPLAPRVMACASLMASVAVEHILTK